MAIALPWHAALADAVTSLHRLEALIPANLTLQAAQARIEAADAVIERVRAEAGLHYFAQSIVGPRSDVVSIAYGNNSIVRMLQRVGATMPMLGSRDKQQEAILAVRTDAQLQRIDLAAQQRILLAALRESYVQYWSDHRGEGVARRFLEVGQTAVEPARALRRVGFWTQANLLAFLDDLDRTRADADALHDEGDAALAKIRAVAGEMVAPFEPPDPDFPLACTSDQNRAVASAFESDGQLKRFDAEISRRENSLSMVRWSSIDASVELGVGAYADAPRGLGYDLTLDLNVNLPPHRKTAERAYEKALRAEIAAFRDDAEQRRRDLTASVAGGYATLAAARAALAHALVDATAKDEALRVARVRFRNLPAKGAAAFEDVQARTAESYASERAAIDARTQVYLKTNDLLLLAPGACT